MLSRIDRDLNIKYWTALLHKHHTFYILKIADDLVEINTARKIPASKITLWLPASLNPFTSVLTSLPACHKP
jgi:hypothetical protein